MINNYKSYISISYYFKICSFIIEFDADFKNFYLDSYIFLKKLFKSRK